MSYYCGVDPGLVSGATAAIDHHGNFIGAFFIEHQDKRILPIVFKNSLLKLIDPKEGAEIAIENVHSMPGQGIASTARFMRAVGVIEAVCELTHYPVHMVAPQTWKKYWHLTSNKDESLDVARMIWPEAPLKRKKDHGVAEALLIADYWRQVHQGVKREKNTISNPVNAS
jgi:Holliday junction resolvasome RuvABC endonuclease subunit